MNRDTFGGGCLLMALGGFLLFVGIGAVTKVSESPQSKDAWALWVLAVLCLPLGLAVMYGGSRVCRAAFPPKRPSPSTPESEAPSPSTTELEGLDIGDIQDMFVVAHMDPLQAYLAGKSQQEKMTTAVALAYALWNEQRVREWCDRNEKLVSMAGAGNPVNRMVALECVRRNFPHTSYAAFAVKCAEVQGLGQVALVLGLKREPTGG